MDNKKSLPQGMGVLGAMANQLKNAPEWVKKMPYPSTYMLILECLQALHCDTVPPEMVLALIVRESHCNPWFCKCDLLFKQNIQAVHAITGLRTDIYLQRVTVKVENLPPQIAKFRLEPTWWHQIKGDTRYGELSDWDKALLASSFGLGQKWALALVDKMPKENWLPYLHAFMASPTMQINHIVKDLEALHRQSAGSWELALTRYNAGIRAKHISEYGAQVARMAHSFQEVKKRAQSEGE